MSVFSLFDSARSGMRRATALGLCAAALLAVSPLARALDMATLMQNLGKHKERHGKFVETRYLAVLNKPLRFSGEVRYVAPELFEKKTLEPAADLMQVHGDRLYMEKDGRKYRMLLSKQPQAAVFVDAIAGLLKGDAAVLERNYDYRLEGKASKWTLILAPKDQKARGMVSKIIATGDQNQLKTIEYVQADGDRSVMVVEPLMQQQASAQSK